MLPFASPRVNHFRLASPMLWPVRALAALAVCVHSVWSTDVATAEGVSSPAILQMYEARWETIEDRMADIHSIGYGQMWLPPPQRADTGGFSVGYDVFDRFDLGILGVVRVNSLLAGP